jgi:hypothetical protein
MIRMRSYFTLWYASWLLALLALGFQVDTYALNHNVWWRSMNEGGARALTGKRHRHEQSWDQENLKRTDSGCPTAIYIAPHGELQQCQ